MNNARPDTLARLTIEPQKKNRGRNSTSWVIALVVVALLIGAVVFLSSGGGERPPEKSNNLSAPLSASNAPPPAPKPGEPALTVSGYVIPRERIEISPKFMSTVKVINVKKGDAVKKGDILVELEDDEYTARKLEAEGRVKMSEANLANAEREFQRQQDLAKSNADSQKALDEARRNRDWAAAELDMVKGQRALAETYFGWCTIRAPINGTILEKLVNPNELVVPQSYGSGNGPSTAFLAMADLNDLQVELDINEADTPKVHLDQLCRISPEAYPDKTYQGRVAEIAPEANRSKGTLQVKVQVENPDRFLTPELTAKVDFLAD
jgi:RND family efflux transporter MFP subunit